MTMYATMWSMKKIAAGEFKARCLTLMDDVQATRVPILITKRGKPVAKLVPVVDNEERRLDRPAEWQDAYRGRH